MSEETRYGYKIGEGAKMTIEIECNLEQRVCLMDWIRAHNLAGVISQLGKGSAPVKPGEKRPCGCGE